MKNFQKVEINRPAPPARYLVTSSRGVEGSNLAADDIKAVVDAAVQAGARKVTVAIEGGEVVWGVQA